MQSEYWDKESFFYKKQWNRSPVSSFDYSCTKNVLLRMLAPRPDDEILEIGCGLGTWTRLVAPRCRDITAIDISKKMIEDSKRNVKLRNVKFGISDFMLFSTKKKFDKIFAVRSLEYLNNMETGIMKVYDMLKDGGHLVVVTKSKPCAWDIIYHERWKRTGFRQNKVSHIKMRRILHKAGFRGIEVSPVIVRAPIFSGGIMELPLVMDSVSKYILKVFGYIGNFKYSIAFAESYAITAMK